MRTSLPVTVLVGALAMGCDPPERAPREPGRPNVVVIVLDSLRADHVGCYGYERPTTPRLDAYAAGATRYTHALASAPWTLPSHASMLTGKHPFEHGAHSYEVDRPVDDNVSPLDDGQLTLAEHLGEHGYATGAFLANEAFLAPRYNLDQGFDIYEVEHVFAEDLNPRLLRWVDRHPDEPLFLLVNYMDVHQPFNLAPRDGFLEHVASKKRSAPRKLVRAIRDQLLPGHGPIPEKKLAKLVDMYDLALANMDEELGALLDQLERRGVLDEAVVVVTSDHGENFGEHHLLGHSKDIYRQTMDVPLVVRLPGQTQGATDDRVLTSADLPRLVLDGFREPLGDDGAFPPLDHRQGALGENYYTRVKDLFGTDWDHRFDRVRRSLVRDSWKLIQSSDGQHELYDLAADPQEIRNLYQQEPGVAAAMMATIEALVAQAGQGRAAPAAAPLTEEEKRMLRELGYVE